MAGDFAPGTLVRLISDPGRTGILTGRVRTRGDIQIHQVQFSDGGRSFHPEYELELADSNAADPFEALSRGRFGRPSDLRRHLTYIQLSGKLANLVYSMETTNTEFYAYQFKPVLSFLDSPSNGLLIADEVGLGKTIEAGLIWTELRARYDARRLLVVCPAMLQPKWQAELRNRFAIDAQLMDAGELLNELQRDRQSVVDGRGIICSMQGIRPPRGWRDAEVMNSPRVQLARLLDEQADGEPVFDLVVVDEAHYMRNPESQTAALGRMLRDVTEHIVLLSATPINLRDDDLFHLLNLVDPDSFSSREVFPHVVRANEPLLRARKLALTMRATGAEIRAELQAALDNELLANSRQLKELVALPLTSEELAVEKNRIALANRIERVNLLQHAISRTRKVEVTAWRVVRQPYTHFVDLDPSGTEWRFYQDVTEAIRRYAIEADISEGFLLASPQRQVSSCMYAAAKSWSDRSFDYGEQTYEDFGAIDENRGDISPLIAHLQATVLPNIDLKELRASDSKYATFLRVLQSYLGDNSEEQVVVFSYFRGTIAYLKERLLEDGIRSQDLLGGMGETKQDVIDRFRRDKSIRVLLSTEVASEGVDLQFCRVLINYDLPWNPMKVEQRIGRIDRIGQEAKSISILNLCYANTIDQRIHDRLYQRLGIFERALGGMEAVLGEQISELTSDLLRHELTPEQEAERVERTALAIEQIRQQQEELEQQASGLIAHGGYILSQVEAAHQFKRRITNNDLRIYVEDYLRKHWSGFVFQQIDGGLLFDIQLPPALATELQAFINQERLRTRTALATGDRVRCRFENKVQSLSRSEELISQFHPFIRFIGRDLQRRNESFYPLVAILLPKERAAGLRPGDYGFSVSRCSYQGLKVEEELLARVAPLGEEVTLLDPDESFEIVSQARLYGEDWLAAASEVDRARLAEALDRCEIALQADYEKAAHQRSVENQDRVAFQVQSAERHRNRQIGRLQEVLEGLRERGNRRMIAPTEGRIRKVQQKFEMQVERLRQQERMTHSKADVCAGIVRVTG